MTDLVLRFVDGKSVADDAIRAFQKDGSFSHCEFWLPEGCLGALPTGGVQIRPHGYDAGQINGDLLIHLTSVTHSQAAGAIAAAKTQINHAYDWTAIAAFPLGRDWRTTGEWFCAELCGWAIEQPKFWTLASDVNHLTPRDIRLLASAVPNRIFVPSGLAA